MLKLKIERLDAKTFEPFGRVLARPDIPPAAAREDLDAWLGYSDLMGMEGGNPRIAYLQVRRNDLPLNQLERHCQAPEGFIPLEGSSVIIVAPISDPEDPDAFPDEDAVRAFLLDGSAGILLPRGSWHWAPYPITETATFLLLHDRDILDDIQIRKVGTYTLEL
jgi:ureidoglycolate hydrolase